MTDSIAALIDATAAAAVAHEIAQILRERHGGSSTTADWLDGVGGRKPASVRMASEIP